MKLNPDKCAFVVIAGKLFGFMVIQRGTEDNPKKIQMITDMQSPKRGKYVQKLTGRVTALNRFISRSTNKCLLFFNTLRESMAFNWIEECEKAFYDLKTYLGLTPLLSKPIACARLFTYLAMSEVGISLMLIKEVAGIQSLVYYISKQSLDVDNVIWSWRN